MSGASIQSGDDAVAGVVISRLEVRLALLAELHELTRRRGQAIVDRRFEAAFPPTGRGPRGGDLAAGGFADLESAARPAEGHLLAGGGSAWSNRHPRSSPRSSVSTVTTRRSSVPSPRRPDAGSSRRICPAGRIERMPRGRLLRPRPGEDAPHEPVPAIPSQVASGGIDAAEFAELVRSFNEVTVRLESTHASLKEEVVTLKRELADAQARLRRSRQLAALGEMAAGIAHEIRNPLGAIGLTLERLTEDLAGRPEQLELCGRVSRAVVRLDTIVGDVLSFARDTRVQPVRVDVARPLLAALEATEDLVERHSVDVDLDLEDGIEADIDASLFEQAVLNVMRNACEAMAAVQGPRRLVVRLRRREIRDPREGLVPHAVAEIEDTGPGIDEATRERIFNPFFTTRAEGRASGSRSCIASSTPMADASMCRSSSEGTRMLLAVPEEYRAASPADEGGEEDGRSLDGAVRRRVRDNAETGVEEAGSDRGAA